MATEGIVASLRAAASVDAVVAGRLADVLDSFREALYLPTTDYIEVALGAVAANYLDGEPVWLLLVAPPSGGKTVVLDALLGLRDVHEVATLTEASLLSGTPKKESKNARGGLLKVMGDFGVLLCKDFTSTLAMNRDARGPALAALREVYDGRWTRHVGSDGGRTLHWHGKAGFIGGVTEAIDSHHAVTSALGERFLLFRLPVPSDTDRRTLAGRGSGLTVGAETKAVLQDGVRRLFDAAPLTGPAQSPPQATQDVIADLANFATVARSAVERDHHHEVCNVPGRELPTRLARQLATLRAGLAAIGVTETRAVELLSRVAVSCIPPMRVAVFRVLLREGDDGVETRRLATEIGRPTGIVRRTLEDLACHGLAVRTKESAGRQGDTYAATPEALRLCVPAIRVIMQSEVSIN